MPYGANLYTTAIILRGRPQLPRASWFEQVGIDDLASQRARVRPVVAQPLPNVPNGPRIALRHLGMAFTDFVDLKVFDMNIWPHFRSPISEVPGSGQNDVWRQFAVFADADTRHDGTVDDRIPGVAILRLTPSYPRVGFLCLSPADSHPFHSVRLRVSLLPTTLGGKEPKWEF